MSWNPDPKPPKKNKSDILTKVYRSRTCKICKEKFDRNFDNQICCGYDCNVKYALKILEKKRKAEWKERKQELKEDLGVVKKQSAQPLQKSINKIVRLIDKGLPCTARPTENHTHFDAGHVFGVGAHPSLRYNLDNIHIQSVKSNRDLGGESLLMLDGIEIRYGKEYRDYVESLPKLYPVLKLTSNERRDSLKTANRIIRNIENRGIIYTRDEVQELLGIYK